MKIIYISTSEIPSRAANSIHVMKMCNAFAALGHEVVLIASSGDKTVSEEASDVYDFYGVEKNFGLKYIQRWRGVGKYLYGVFAVLWTTLKAPDVIYTRDPVAALVLCLFGQRVFF